MLKKRHLLDSVQVGCKVKLSTGELTEIDYIGGTKYPYSVKGSLLCFDRDGYASGSVDFIVWVEQQELKK